ncbi:MAG: hypothetical protein OEV30_02265 [Ignavibacteria bacterium]|nr:hypothetical protein [Ignavibacteria bacterium]
MTNWWTAFPTVALVVLVSGCSSIHHSYEYDDVTQKRMGEQLYLEDSLSVFFAKYPNPYRDKEVLWLASFLEGAVALEVHSMENDSLVAVYRFDPQEAPIYPIAYRGDAADPVKCVITVNGRPKCATLLPSFYVLNVPQWGTTYTIEQY